MIQDVVYNEDDIRKFLKINEIEKAKDENTLTFKKLLSVQSKISILKKIMPEDLRVITYNLKFLKINYKDVVIEEGDITQDIFYIFSGECQVFVNNKKVASLHSGETFGESAAIFLKKRNAKVICASKGAVLLSFCIDHDNMEFSAEALATIYKNLAYEINGKLEYMNSNKK